MDVPFTSQLYSRGFTPPDPFAIRYTESPPHITVSGDAVTSMGSTLNINTVDVDGVGLLQKLFTVSGIVVIITDSPTSVKESISGFIIRSIED